MTTWKSFLTRALSALIALAIIIGLYLSLNLTGLRIAVAFAMVMSAWELLGVLFHKEQSKFLKFLFIALASVVFAATAASLSVGALVYSLAAIAFAISVLWSRHKEGRLEEMAIYQSKASLGLFYVGLLPAFAFRILDQAYGLSWFVYLLAVVFAGDTLAYVFGVLFGKNKMMPNVSPKKSWQGSIGGLLGSALAGYLCWHFLLDQYSAIALVVLALIAGFLGQCGDFFESLLKRVADVKDSGKIMPGHGGVLDRIDGVLFASPVVLTGILILSHLSS